MIAPHPAPATGTTDAAAIAGAVWIDLVDPSPDECRRVEQARGIRLPSRSGISNIQMSARAHAHDHVLHLSIPYFADADSGDNHPATPLAFLLGPDCLITLRYAPSHALDRVAHQVDAGADAGTGADILAAIIESIVDIAARSMEELASELGAMSERVFAIRGKRVVSLSGPLREVGQLHARLNRIRYVLLGVMRIVTFMGECAVPWLGDAARGRIAVAHGDLAVLDEFDDQLTNKLQFLLDSVLGFINIDQNDIMKVFTVFTVATVPPVILAGIWGMNFKDMPELGLPFAYPFALLAIVLSFLIPLAWFRHRGWLSRANSTDERSRTKAAPADRTSKDGAARR